MAYDLKQFKSRLEEITDWLKKELSGIRTGRASASLLDGVKVNFYGSHSPINQMASIISEDAKTLKITPYDTTQTQSIEKAIADADLGVSVIVNDGGVRVIFPDLTSERRELLVKQVNKKLEEARISIRKERDDIWSEIQHEERDGKISEDEKFSSKDEMQKSVDEVQKNLEKLAKDKEDDIKS